MKKQNKGGKRLLPFVAFAGVLAIAMSMSLCGRQASGDKSYGDKSYKLEFDKGFPAGQSYRDDLGITVVVAVDRSGSMNDMPASGLREPKYVQASRALTEVLGVLRELVAKQKGGGLMVKLGLLSFSDEVEVLLPPTELSLASLAQITAFARDPDNFKPGGMTAIGKAVEKGTELLALSGTIMRSLIVITDGENTKGIEPASVLDAVYKDRNTSSKPDLPVTTSSTLISFIGFDIEASRFSELAKQGARVSSAADQDQLVAALKGILEADITRLESPVAPGGK